MKDWVFKNSARAAFYFLVTYGVPVEVFSDWWKKLTLQEQSNLCVNVLNKYDYARI